MRSPTTPSRRRSPFDSRLLDGWSRPRADQLAGALRTQRAVFKLDEQGAKIPRPPDDPVWKLDPRVLVFEVLTTFMVREQQLELVEKFLATTREGRSRVVQVRRVIDGFFVVMLIQACNVRRPRAAGVTSVRVRALCGVSGCDGR